MKFNLEYYRAFFMVANFLSFTKAAEQLFLSQPAVSQAVKKLELELGCPLFIREPYGLQLTKEGEVLYAHVKKAFEELQTGEYQIMKLANFKMGDLQIGATETSLRFLLAPQIRDFKACFPSIHITFSGSTTSNTCQQLQNGDIEVAFLIAPIPAKFHFHLTRICDIHDILVASSQFPIDFSQTYDLADIAKFPLISVTTENSVRAHIENWFLENNILFTPEFAVRSTGLVLPLIQNHLGIGIIPSNFVSEEIEKGSLKQVKTNTLPKPRTLYLATNPSTPISSICKEFIQFIMNHI
ncbi:MAG: LysR family transcriptional regulator [Hungatella hathewayi]|nr:LysR family transcriptional regulator [Hungatella hathewayi]